MLERPKWPALAGPLLPAILLLAILLLSLGPLRPARAQGAFGNTWQTGTPQDLSAGCSARSTPAPPENLYLRGVERTFITRVPQGYTPGRPHDLVVAFHGRTNSNTQARDYYDLDESLPEAIVVYPSALSFDSGFRWSDPGDSAEALRDYELFDALVARFAAQYCIDLGRVFVVGHSLGASFANSVACYRGEIVRAVASVAGGIEGTNCDGGAAALIVHHPEDMLVPISQGQRVKDAFVESNGLADEPVPVSKPELAELGCVRYGPDSPDPVLWCVHDFATTRGGRYYPHNWPDATGSAIARFFGDLP